MVRTPVWPNFPPERKTKELRTFFAYYDVVASANFTFNLAPSWLAGTFECVRAFIKTPLELLVGIKPAWPKTETRFSKIRSYDVRTDAYSDSTFESITDRSEPILEEIRSFLSERWKRPVEIGILSETQRGHGFWFSWTFSVALTKALFEYAGIEPSEKDVFDTALRFTKLLRYDNTSWANCATGIREWWVFLVTPENSTEDGRTFGNVSFWGIKKYDGSVPDALPLDFWIVFSGLNTNTKSVEAYKNSDVSNLDVFSDFLREEMGVSPNFDSALSAISARGGMYECYSKAAAAGTVKVGYFVAKLRNEGYREDWANGLIESSNEIRHSLAMAIPSEPFARLLYKEFVSQSDNPNPGFGLFPLYGWKNGGGYVFVMKPHVGRPTLDSAVEKIRSAYPDARIEYANYLHGESTRGAAVRQNLTVGNLAEEMRGSNGFIFRDNGGDFRAGDFSAVVSDFSDGILFDQAAWEISVNGKKVNSTQIKSQNATIELMGALIEKKTVKNTELPSSSYSKSRSEMQSKILGPLTKLAEDSFGLKIGITCSGSLSDFVLELEDGGIRLGYVRKITNGK